MFVIDSQRSFIHSGVWMLAQKNCILQNPGRPKRQFIIDAWFTTEKLTHTHIYIYIIGIFQSYYISISKLIRYNMDICSFAALIRSFHLLSGVLGAAWNLNSILNCSTAPGLQFSNTMHQ